MPAQILHVVEMLTPGEACRSLLAIAAESRRIGPYAHSLISLLPPAPEALALADAAGVRLIVAPTPLALRQELTDADLVQAAWWNGPALARFLRGDLTELHSALPPMRLLLWLHAPGDTAPHLLTPALLALPDQLVAGNPRAYAHPAFRALPPAERHSRIRLVLDAPHPPAEDGVSEALQSARTLHTLYAQLLAQPKRPRLWGLPPGARLLDQPLSLADLNNSGDAPLAGAALFVDTLGEALPHFAVSLGSGEGAGAIERLIEAETTIAQAPLALLAEGVLPFRAAYPKDPHLNLWAGLILFGQGQYPEAANALSAAIQCGCNHWRVAYYLARNAEQMGDLKLALKGAQIVLNVAPDFEPARTLAARLEAALAPPPPTEEEVRAEEQRNEELMGFLCQAEDAYLRADYDQALAALHQAESIRPDYPDLMVMTGNVLLQLGDLEAARRAFVQATLLAPTYPIGFTSLAGALLMQGRLPEARLAARQALSLDPANADAHRLLEHMGCA